MECYDVLELRSGKFKSCQGHWVINLHTLVSAGSSYKHAIANQGCSVVHKRLIQSWQAVLFKRSDFRFHHSCFVKRSGSYLRRNKIRYGRSFIVTSCLTTALVEDSHQQPSALKNTPVYTAKPTMNFWNQWWSIWWVDRKQKNSGKTLWRLRSVAPNWSQFSQFVLVEVLIITKMPAVKRNMHVLKPLMVGSFVQSYLTQLVWEKIREDWKLCKWGQWQFSPLPVFTVSGISHWKFPTEVTEAVQSQVIAGLHLSFTAWLRLTDTYWVGMESWYEEFWNIYCLVHLTKVISSFHVYFNLNSMPQLLTRF